MTSKWKQANLRRLKGWQPLSEAISGVYTNKVHRPKPHPIQLILMISYVTQFSKIIDVCTFYKFDFPNLQRQMNGLTKLQLFKLSHHGDTALDS